MTLATPTNAISDVLFQASPFENVATTTITPTPESSIVDQEPVDTESPFVTFAKTLRADLPANSLLEKVLVERVILSSWRLQVASEQDSERILLKNKVTPVTPEILRAECSLETAFSLLETARRVGRPRWERFAETSASMGLAEETVGEFEAFDDSSLDNLSNEWPILNADSNPRDAFREINRETFDDQEEIEEESAVEPTRWQDRLVFDFNISETSPVVKGTWITVNQVVSLIVDGYRWSDVLRDHPELTEDDIRVCLAYTIEQDDFGNV